MKAAFFGIILFVLVCFGVTNTFGQESQIWVDPTLVLPLSEKLRLNTDLYFRTPAQSANWKQTIIRPALAYNPVKNISLLIGLGWFKTYFGSLPSRDEIRPWAGILYQQNLQRGMSLIHYFRVEERLFFQEGTENFMTTRWRYRIGTNLPVAANEINKGKLEVLLQVEPFVTQSYGKQSAIVFNMLRAYAGISRTWNAQIRSDLVYIPQWSRQTNSDQLQFTDHLFRLQIFYTFHRKSNAE